MAIKYIYCVRKQMFKRLFSSHSEIQKVFQECRIDKTHEMPHTKAIVDLAVRYLIVPEERQNIHININIQNTNSNNINININNPKTKAKLTKQQEFISHFLKKLNTENIILRIKTLVVGHALLKKLQDRDFFQCFEVEIEKYICSDINPEQEKKRPNEESIEIKVETTKEDYLQTNIISFYCYYLKKLIINFQTHLFAKRYPSLNQEQQKKNIIQVINHGFVVLNLINYILRSQYTFNKMGRYYLEHKQLLGVFIKYLQDLLIYNTFIKTVSSLSLKTIKEAGSEETKHHFLFLNEAQKTSDRLYEFFYNRYYYNEIKTLILMPTFLNIHNEEYKEIVSVVKRRDKELVLLVRKSKYQQPRSHSCHNPSNDSHQNTIRTQGSYSNNSSLTFSQFSQEKGVREKRVMSQHKKHKE